jgi:hypothetical protein
MAKHGLGRPTTRLLECECPAIDLGRILDNWRRTGAENGICSWFDPATGRDDGRVTFQLESRHIGPILRLTYVLAGESIEDAIPLQSTVPRFGGRTWWFSCPMAREDGQRCSRRVAKLYLPSGGRLGCRACHSLVYLTSRESHRWDLLIRRAGWTVPEGLELIRRAMDRNPRRGISVAPGRDGEPSRPGRESILTSDRGIGIDDRVSPGGDPC